MYIFMLVTQQKLTFVQIKFCATDKMGVKGLWGLLAPHAHCEPLYKLRGEKIAIDLSGWICDSQSFAEQHAQPRLYLRNLYFRASYLILNGITPVFVLEGEAPKLKQDTMANRNLIQHQNNAKTSKNPSRLRKPCTQRKRFKSVLNQCEILLKSMGLECVRGVGEAEAMCAHLNLTGAVSSVISQDSDCFVYGAKRVYKNFSVSNSGSSATNCGSVEVYDLEKIKESLDFGRKKMVALALLCGSDYNGNGIEGVGQSTAVSFLLNFDNETILERFSSWVSNKEMFENYTKIVEDTKYCSGCGHLGNIRSHSRIGCKDCATSSGCDQSTFKNYYQNLKNELNIRNKVLKSSEDFPSADIIEEYLVNKESTPKDFNPLWNKPDMIKFVKLMCDKLNWPEIYGIEKFLPLLTKWQLMNKAKNHLEIDLFLGADPHKNPDWLKPLFIKKKRNLKGIPCYEIIWKDSDGHYEGLIPLEQLSEKNEEELWTTVEPQDLVAAAYPDLVDTFLSSQKSKKKSKPTKKCLKNNLKITNFLQRNEENVSDELVTDDKKFENLNHSFNNLSIHNVVSNKPKAVRKRKIVNPEVSFKTKPRKSKKTSVKKLNASQRKIDSFVNIDTAENYEKLDYEPLPSVNDSYVNLYCRKSLIMNFSCEKQTINANIENSMNSMNDDIDDDDMSLIIDNIVSRNDNHYDEFLKSNYSSPAKSIKYFSTPLKMSSASKLKSLLIHNQFNSSPLHSSFFEKFNDKPDVFEQSFEINKKLKHKSSYCSKKSWTKIYNSLNNSNNVSFQNR